MAIYYDEWWLHWEIYFKVVTSNCESLPQQRNLSLPKDGIAKEGIASSSTMTLSPPPSPHSLKFAWLYTFSLLSDPNYKARRGWSEIKTAVSQLKIDLSKVWQIAIGKSKFRCCCGSLNCSPSMVFFAQRPRLMVCGNWLTFLSRFILERRGEM